MKFIRKLLEKNVYSGVRRIYKQKVKSIPTLKMTLDDGTEIRVKDDVTKAELFLENFLANSKVIEEVEEDRQYVEKIARECSGHLKNFDCVGEEIVRTRPSPDHVTEQCLFDVFESMSFSAADVFDACNSYFTLNKIRLARQTLKKEKGSVGLNNDHIRKLGSSGIDKGLQLLFNTFWHFSYLPRYYRTSLIHPLFKGGVDRYRSNVKDYRGISLSDTVGRLFENVLYNRLKLVVLDKIKSYQGGGMSKRGSILQLFSIIERAHAYRSESRINRLGNDKPFNYVILVVVRF